MKKIMIIGLVLLFILGITGVYLLLGIRNDSLPKPLVRKIKRIIHYVKGNQLTPMKVSDNPYQWLKGKDLQENDLSNKKEILITCMFDAKTKWPAEDKMPLGFDPDQVIKWGENHELGLDELHQQGYTGRGVNIAVVDGILNRKHKEIKDNLVYYEEVQNLTEVGINFHGTAVASIAAGKNIGAAPEANLHYFAIYDNPNKNKYQANIAEGIERIIEYNDRHPEGEKIRLVISALGYNEQTEGGQKYCSAVKYAEENNILVLEPYVNMLEDELLRYYILGASCAYPQDKNDYNNYKFDWIKKMYLKQLNVLQEIAEKNDSWNEFEVDLKNEIEYLSSRDQWRILLRIINNNSELLQKKYTTIDEFREYIKETIDFYHNEILHVPSAGITIASDKGRDQYIFDGSGGISWTLPYYAGVAAIALQIEPGLSNQEIIDLIDTTAVVNEPGMKMIAPQEMVKELLDKEN